MQSRDKSHKYNVEQKKLDRVHILSFTESTKPGETNCIRVFQKQNQ